MAQVVWTAEASRWLQDIYDYIAADNEEAAHRTVLAIHEVATWHRPNSSDPHAVTAVLSRLLDQSTSGRRPARHRRAA